VRVSYLDDDERALLLQFVQEHIAALETCRTMLE
jgi:hypothetical protein